MAGSRVFLVWLGAFFLFASGRLPAMTSLQELCAKQVDGEIRVQLDWDQITDQGFISRLVRDPQFLRLELDLRRGQYVTMAQFYDVLDLPIVRQNIAPFVREVLIGTSHIHFNVQRSMGEILEPVIVALARAGEQETFTSQVLPLANGNQLNVLLWTSQFDRARNSPDLRPLVDSIIGARSILARHTTRAIEPPPGTGTVPGYQTFPAGRFGIVVTLADGSQRFLVMETEQRVGHLSPVDPGHTVVDGYVRLVDSEQALYGSEGLLFSVSDLSYFFRRVVADWGLPTAILASATTTPPTRSGNAAGTLPRELAEGRAILVNALAAIYADGNASRLQANRP